MGKRTDLHTIFTNITANVYFQPPESIKLVYPCIIYNRDKIESEFANNEMYNSKTRYSVQTIDRDPEMTWQEALLSIPNSTHVRSFIVDGLNHDEFEIYY